MAQYVSFENLKTYNTNILAYINQQDAKMLSQSDVSFVEITTGLPTGVSKRYDVYQGDATKAENKIQTIDIPSGQVITAVALETDTDGKYSLKFTLETGDPIVADLSTISARFDKLEGAATVTGSIKNLIDTLAKDAKYSETTTYSIKVGATDYVTGLTQTQYTDLQANLTTAGYTISDVVYGGSAATVEVGTNSELIVDNGTPVTINNGDYSFEQGATPISIASAINALENTPKHVISIKKLEATDVGYNTTYAATYTLVQGGEVKGTINIPKDFLVKSGSVKVYADTDTEVKAAITDIVAGEKYLDFIVNAVDDSETDKHMYIAVKDLVDIYTGTPATAQATADVIVTVSADNVISATVRDGSLTRTKIDSAFETAIANMETALAKKADGSYDTVVDQVKANAKDATYKVETVDGAEVTTTLAQAIAALEASASDTNGAMVFKGTVAAMPADAKVGDTYVIGDEIVTKTATSTASIAVTPDKVGTDFELVYDNETDPSNPTIVPVTIKQYIDSRIFMGTAQQIQTAKDNHVIDKNAFIVEVDETTEGFSAIPSQDIDDLFSSLIDTTPTT